MLRRLLPVVAIAAAACGAEPLPPSQAKAPSPTAAVSVGATPSPPALRLPRTAAPVRYAATLTLVPSADAFEGMVDIDLTFAEPTSFLWLNGTDITIGEAHLEIAGRSIAARAVRGGEDFVGFAFAETVPAGAARLHVAYRGEISGKDDRGVFKEKEEDAHYLFSQFENIEARRAFPCFDEPSFKVPWQLTLRVLEGDVALANTPVVSEQKDAGGMKVVRFAETKPLPSYLIAFAVGPFDLVDAGRAGKKATPIRIATPRGRASRAAYAVKTAPALLARLEDFFGIPYPYEKLDLVAVPHLVSFAAMENVGLITYLEAGLLARPEEETIVHQQRFAATVAHEMAHQWFGDLVTMAWWDDIWLNEAFATWMEEKILVAFEPRWHAELSRSRASSAAMHGDALVSARRIRQAIGDKDDIQNAFDEITYNKGAAVIGMFESFVGPERFRLGIRRYLEQHAHGNATGADFLAAISAATSADIGPAFATFLDQPGVPLVRAELACTPGSAGEAHVKLAQRRYLPAGSAGAPDASWHIPVCLHWGADRTAGRSCTMLRDHEATVPIAGTTRCPDWVMLNAGDAGYYHAGYQAGALAALLGKGWARLSPIEHGAVIRDLGALLRSGDLPAADVLARIPDLARDRSPDVVDGALGLVEAIRDTMLPEPLRPRYARFVQKVFGARARALGWLPRPGDDDGTRMLRPNLLLSVALRGDDPALVAEATALAHKWIDDPRGVPADVVDAVLFAAASRGDRGLFDRLRAAAKKATDASRRERLVRAMAGFRDPAIARAALELFLTDELDARVAIELFWQDPRMTDVVFAFLREHYDAVVSRVPGELRADVPFFVAGFCDDARRAEVETFLKDRAPKLTGGTRNLAKALERMKLCAAQRRAHEASLAAFLAAY